ncbi:MAG TPA: lipid A deacylase LpxR family protein [Opitutales bacterium]|nr:lipid A deacylase LpxR family protein [Opitutales bacterium]
MKSRILKLLLLSILPCALGADTVAAVDPSSDGDFPAPLSAVHNPHWTSSVQFENDIFANTDCYYTNGVKLSWVSPDLTEYRDAGTIPDFFYRISDYLPFIHEKAIQRNVAINFGQNMYAPVDITTPDPDPMDRPYCGWLYVGFAFHNKTVRWMSIIELNIGVTGAWSMADQTQTFVHHVKGCDIPRGWAHQVGNEVVVNLVGERRVRFWRLGDEEGMAADSIAHIGGSLGTLYTYASTGFTVRCGWNLPTDFGSSPIRIAGDVNAPAASDDPRLRDSGRWGIHFFGDIDGRAVLRDGTLDGNLFGDSPSVGKKPFVMDASFGVSLVRGSWKFSYAQVARSKEFNGQADNWHVFGSISLSYTY